MKYLDEYRDATAVRRVVEELRADTTRPWNIMEVCGGQTHTIVRYGLDTLLPEGVNLIHGPGCPVCVTPVELIDRAIHVAGRDGVIFSSFGDMLRVPGSDADLFMAKSNGADVRIVYSPLDALALARRNPDRDVVFFAVGFETTAPANAMAVYLAQKQGIRNFSILVSHVLVPPAIESILSSPDNRVQAFLAAGHVCAVMGYEEYEPLVRRFRVPIVVTGFEPLDILQGVHLCVRQLERGEAMLENQYARAVRREGNRRAREIMDTVFTVGPRQWRGIGEIPASGLHLSPEYGDFDAAKRFDAERIHSEERGDCMSGQILQGIRKPEDCPHFAAGCTPEHPLGATMVSTEGACAAYYRYRRPGQEAMS
ncbi:MAG: hydrogenase formation protein HypD [Gemmatimonadetes bacterium]|nr:hydrogenase formation protein HypD [Gemmatimonadota bacterium]